MSDAPERIWAWAKNPGARLMSGEWRNWDAGYALDTTEYIRADLARPKVKPLEWLGGGRRWHAGDYVIEDKSYGQREVRRLHRASFGSTYIADFTGERPLEAAKAAAQQDYERRVLAAFEVPE